MLLLVMISLHMLTFRMMVTMVIEFCSLVILIQHPSPMHTSFGDMLELHSNAVIVGCHKAVCSVRINCGVSGCG